MSLSPSSRHQVVRAHENRLKNEATAAAAVKSSALEPKRKEDRRVSNLIDKRATQILLTELVPGNILKKEAAQEEEIERDWWLSVRDLPLSEEEEGEIAVVVVAVVVAIVL